MLKKIVFILLWTGVSGVHAAYVGNPAFPKIPEEGGYVSKEAYLSVKTGYIGDYVFDQRMKLHGSGLRSKVNTFQTLTNSATFLIGFKERWEVTGCLGSFQARVSQQPRSNLKLKYQTRSQFFWSGGFNGIVFDRGGTSLSINGSYDQTSPSLRTLSANGASLSARRAELRFRQWQAGIGIAQLIGAFVPYMGVEYRSVRARLDHARALEPFLARTHLDFRSKIPVGIFFGCSLTPHKTVLFNIEARLVDEEALAISGLVKF